MGIYYGRTPYPQEFDEVVSCPNSETCPHANGDCFDAGCCLNKNE